MFGTPSWMLTTRLGEYVPFLLVTVGRDFGKEPEVLGGLKAGDDVVVNASDDLESGQLVEVVPLAKP